MKNSKTIKYPTKLINDAARDAGMTPEEYVAQTRSFFAGREVYAHFIGTEQSGRVSVFSLN